MEIYELLILGAGPSGISAAIYAARKKINFKIITLDIGGQALWSSDIENYIGYQFITGVELVSKFQEHLKSFDIQINTQERITKILKEKSLIKVITDKAFYLAKTIIIATGKRPKLLNVEGEETFRGRGISYCATCDAPLFRDKIVAVIGGGNSALDAVLQLIKISPLVYIVNIANDLTADPIMIEKVKEAKNVRIFNSSKVIKIYGEKFVKGVIIEKENKNLNLEVEGIFIEIGLIPNSEFIDIVSKNKDGEIIVDCYNSTNQKGIFAAGDVTNVPEKQIIIACGEGAKATLSVFKYLSLSKF